MTSRRRDRRSGMHRSEKQCFDAYGGPGYSAYVNEPLRYGVRLYSGF